MIGKVAAPFTGIHFADGSRQVVGARVLGIAGKLVAVGEFDSLPKVHRQHVGFKEEKEFWKIITMLPPARCTPSALRAFSLPVVVIGVSGTEHRTSK